MPQRGAGSDAAAFCGAVSLCQSLGVSSLGLLFWKINVVVGGCGLNGAPPKRLSAFQALEPVNVTLFGKRVFADVMN